MKDLEAAANSRNKKELFQRKHQSPGIPMVDSHEYSWDGFKPLLFKYPRRSDLTIVEDLGIDLSPK